MRIINLASGSDGNITYIESMDKKVVLDMGLSCAESVKRLSLIGVTPYEIDAIIVSHEHSDHIKGIDVFSSRYNVPVYAHEKVWLGLEHKLSRVRKENRKTFEGTFNLDNLQVCPVELPHDVCCYGFSFVENANKISVLTDLGHASDRILDSIRGSQIVYLEANYDRQMLMKNEKYPLALKRRIDGPNGHLSNIASSEIVAFLAKTGTRQVVLSHLSKENNSPLMAYSTICKEIEKQGIKEGVHIRIDVASPTPGSIFKLK